MKQLLFCALFLITFIINKVLCNNECFISQLINQKTFECVSNQPASRNKCFLGKTLLKEYFNVSTRCESVKIATDTKNQSCPILSGLNNYNHSVCITSNLILNLGSSAYASPCTQLTIGYQKCSPKSSGSIVCFSKSFRRFSWKILALCNSNQLCISKTSKNSQCIHKDEYFDLTHTEKCTWLINGKQKCIEKNGYTTCSNFAWTKTQFCPQGTKCAKNPSSSTHILCT